MCRKNKYFLLSIFLKTHAKEGKRDKRPTLKGLASRFVLAAYFTTGPQAVLFSVQTFQTQLFRAKVINAETINFSKNAVVIPLFWF